ncbi:MAG: TonB-dependent receptor [Bacteroidales bacterium]|nr:TonB-dependent receptor [Bacteroidales bacterium]
MESRPLLIACFILTASYVRAQHVQDKLAIHLTESPFEVFVEKIEQQTGQRIFYKDEWVEAHQLSIDEDSATLSYVLEQAIKGTGLVYDIIPGRGIFLLPQRHIEKDIAASIRTSKVVINSGVNDLGMKPNQSFIQGTRPRQIIQTISVGKPEQRILNKPARVMGYITELESGDPVTGATMYIKETGKGYVSDNAGVVIMAVSPGTYTVQFNYIGKEEVNKQMIIYSDGKFTIEMPSSMIAIDEVQIQARHYREINSTDIGVMRISLKSVKQIPLFMGESDVIKIAKLLPGITSAGEASSGVNVRGSSVDQNIFYINRVPIYNTSHLFGFFSAFNSSIIRDYAIYKGNIPANYGGRLASVFDISTRKGNNRKFTGNASISPISTNVTAEGPIIREQASFLINARSTYSDWILEKIEDPLIRDSDALFNDFSGSLNMSINENNSLSAFYYQSYDRFMYSDLSNYEYTNRGGSINWNRQLSSSITSNLSAAVSNYNFSFNDTRQLSQAYTHNYNITHSELSNEYRWIPALNHRVEYGANLIYYHLNRGVVQPYGDVSLRSPMDLGTEQGVEAGIFISDNINIFKWLSLYAGLRYSYYSFLGPNRVREYWDGYPKEEYTALSITEYGSFKNIAHYSGPEIRSAVNFKSGENTSFKLAFNQMRQYLLMLSNTVAISPTDQWKLTDAHIKAPLSYQYSGGVYHIFPSSGISSSIEIYYKSSDNIVDYKDGADFINTSFTETEILQGHLAAYGLELLAEKGSGRLNGWISYTISRSMMEVSGTSSLGSINEGKPYPSNYDRPHVLNLVANYKVNRRLSLGSNLVYMKGRPVSFPSSIYFVDDFAYIDYQSRNQFRVPDYFRIDLSLTLEGNLKAEKPLHSSWSLNVYNLLGRKNPQSIYFEPGEYFIHGYSFSVIGVPLITLTWNAKLGNYESN